MIDHRSYTDNLSSCEIKAWKKFRPELDANPWPVRYRCSDWLSYQAIWELVTLRVRNIPVEVERCKWIYERSYIWTAEKDINLWLIIAVTHSCEIKAWKKFRPESGGIKNIFTLFSCKTKNVKNNKRAVILKLAFFPSIRTSSWNRAGLHSTRPA